MKSELENAGWPAAGGTGAPGMPVLADRAAFQAGLDALRVREKAHTREGDAIAAARRRLPMVEVDSAICADRPARAGWDMPWYSARDSAGALLTGRRAGMMQRAGPHQRTSHRPVVPPRSRTLRRPRHRRALSGSAQASTGPDCPLDASCG
jgi:hypothetical protein